ncbi:C-Jun-amino-terminal kinase-interacting protein 4 isoform X2 [Microcaecilia unicolor]|uniref:C-Jun-amino-terminal kinase-interacting protein 4-like isoform X2 n=1 Tax=Microcaecilia unicolor TaxID=1415580 RepID=A0A6P7XSH2_9AMPH|nr:C-Jun-amino-terminal kinase-interacting protein 4-like isoform X2 [Microcaecilia unicolor]
MESLEEVFGEDVEPGRGLELYDEMVMALSGSIYGELEKLIGTYGQGAITGLMPLLVSVLEGLGEASVQARERQEQLEMLAEDHQRLLAQFEQEREARKRAEERCMETEDSAEQEQRGYQASLASLETQRKLMELKARGYADQIASLEEQRAALNKELSFLAQTHSKLMKNYQDLRFQRSLSLEAARHSGRSSPLPHSEKKTSLLEFQEALSSLESITCHVCPESSSMDREVSQNQTPDSSVGGLVLNKSSCPVQSGLEVNDQTLQDELKPEEDAPKKLRRCSKDGSSVTERLLKVDEIINSTPELELTSEHLKKSAPQWQAEEDLGKEKEKENEEDDHEERNTDSLFAEVSVTSPELIADVDEGADLQGTGNSLEVLMAENANLKDVQMVVDVARKSLIARVEELTAEREDFRREVAALQQNLGRGQMKIRETEQEVQRLRQELEEARKQSSEGSEVDMPAAQRRRFTRAEMARVLMERNQYKERLMELQEAVRRTELLRVSRDVQNAQIRRSSFWKIFDRLFSSDVGDKSSASSPQMHAPHSVSTVTYSNPAGSGGISSLDASQTDGDIAAVSVRQQKREQYRQIRAHIWNKHGREQLHGWSYPLALEGQGGATGAERSGDQIPVLVQLRLLDQKDPSTKLWCATGMNNMDPERDAKKEAKPSPSLVWICSRTHSVSEVMVIDASRSNHVVDQFVIPNSHILCVTSVPGYRLDLVDVPEADQETVTATASDNEATSSHLATVWFGTQEGRLHIHPTVSDWRRCLQTAQLKDAIHSLVHTRDRVIAALGDGTLAIFHRNASRQWDLETPRVVEIGRPPQSIRCAVTVGDKVWCGYRNRIYVVDPRMAKIEKWFEATSHPERQVRHMAAAMDGVWASVRLDSTLRLFHAQTGQILQELQLEPYVQKMQGCSTFGAPFTQVSALAAQCNRLWIGTVGGTVISTPFSAGFSNHSNSSTSPTVPYCNIDYAQICFHGHRDAVKFFAAVPGCINTGLSEAREMVGTLEHGRGTQGTMLVMSGGEGYINFRIGDDTGDTDGGFGDLLLANPRHRRAERSHLIVWQVQT